MTNDIKMNWFGSFLKDAPRSFYGENMKIDLDEGFIENFADGKHICGARFNQFVSDVAHHLDVDVSNKETSDVLSELLENSGKLGLAETVTHVASEAPAYFRNAISVYALVQMLRQDSVEASSQLRLEQVYSPKKELAGVVHEPSEVAQWAWLGTKFNSLMFDAGEIPPLLTRVKENLPDEGHACDLDVGFRIIKVFSSVPLKGDNWQCVLLRKYKLGGEKPLKWAQLSGTRSQRVSRARRDSIRSQTSCASIPNVDDLESAIDGCNNNTGARQAVVYPTYDSALTSSKTTELWWKDPAAVVQKMKDLSFKFQKPEVNDTTSVTAVYDSLVANTRTPPTVEAVEIALKLSHCLLRGHKGSASILSKYPNGLVNDIATLGKQMREVNGPNLVASTIDSAFGLPNVEPSGVRVEAASLSSLINAIMNSEIAMKMGTVTPAAAYGSRFLASGSSTGMSTVDSNFLMSVFLIVYRVSLWCANKELKGKYTVYLSARPSKTNGETPKGMIVIKRVAA